MASSCRMPLGSVSGTANCSALSRRCGPSGCCLKNASQRLHLRLHSSAASFFGFGFVFQGVLQADALPAQKIAIAVQPFLDVGGGCFVRAGVHDQLWPLALKGLVCLA